MDYLAQLPASVVAGTAYFVYVFFKAFQQKNVAFDHYWWVMPVSYGMSFTEVIVIALIAHEAAQGISWDLAKYAMTIGTGGGFGAMLSMLVHNKFIGKHKPRTDSLKRDTK